MQNKVIGSNISESSNVFTSQRISDIQKKENLGQPLKRFEKIWFKNIKGVRKAGVTFGLTDYELQEYAKCKLSVHYFAQKYCQIKKEDGTIGNIKLRQYQKKIIDLFTNNRYSLLMSSRQCGKTVSAAIVILHYVLFNNDKGVMIVANKSKTVKEIIRKIKDIYRLVPFFLQKGVFTWNETSLSFDNGCRIQTENRTKEPSIGFTIDFLYLDEFAKIPKNIIVPYYTSVVPTVSSIQNSKIVITSTPDGFNLFHDLLIDSERDDDDPQKGMYKSMRVYWYEVEGRRNTKMFPYGYKLKQYDLTREEIKNYLISLGYDVFEEVEDNKNFIKVRYDVDDEKTTINNIRTLRYDKLDLSGNTINTIPLSEICMITNWQEEQTKLIGGEDAFAQEYDLQFLTGNKLLFDSIQMEIFKKNENDFGYFEIEKINQRIKLPYTNLKWIKNREDIFNIADMKKYYICASIDLGEGLGEDYSVVNIFRLLPKTKEKIEKTHEKLADVYEFFKLEQIGMFRVNNWSIEEVAEMIHVIMFELFDPEKCKVVLEYNTYGAELLAKLPHVFGDENQYSNGIFLRFKHNKDDKILKIGIKVTKGENEASKKILIKNLQNAVKKSLIELHNDICIRELSMFSKKETPSGDFTYQSETGHDDSTMTLVTVSTVFTHVHYKNMVDTYIEKELSGEIKDIIYKLGLKKMENSSTIDYNSFGNSYKKIYGNKNIGTSPFGGGFKPTPNQPFKPFKTSPWQK